MAESAPPENGDLEDGGVNNKSNGIPKRNVSNNSPSSGSNSSSSSSSSSSEQHSASGSHRHGRNDKRRKRSKKHSSKSDDGASGSDDTAAASAAPSSTSSAASASAAAAAAAAEDAKQTKFIQKVYEMAMAPENSSVLGFALDGLSLELRDSSLLPPLLERHFKHNKPSSFIRQLNNYGFKTITSPSAENSNQHVFAHPLFRRGDPRALEKISRKTAVCVKKKSKGEIIRELQSKMEQMHKQLEQSEMHRLELFQRLMTLEAEGNQRIMAVETENQQLRSHLHHLRRSFQEASFRMDTMARGVDQPGYGTLFPPAILETTSHVGHPPVHRYPGLPHAFPGGYGASAQNPPQPQAAAAAAGPPQGNGHHPLHPAYAPAHEPRQPSQHAQLLEPGVGLGHPPHPPPPPQLYHAPDPRLNFPPVMNHDAAHPPQQQPQQQQQPPPAQQQQPPPPGDTNGNHNGNGMNLGVNHPFHLD